MRNLLKVVVDNAENKSFTKGGLEIICAEVLLVLIQLSVTLQIEGRQLYDAHCGANSGELGISQAGTSGSLLI